jgi:hypothetical protein
MSEEAKNESDGEYAIIYEINMRFLRLCSLIQPHLHQLSE